MIKHFKKILSSNRFYIAILVFFFFESAWIAFSARYPQAFDEDFHFGLIKIYSLYWLPFLSHQPAGGIAFGAVARDPSYLYHYLMSFPYRVITLFIHSQTTQIIILRLIDIVLFSFGLVLFRRVLLKFGLSKSFTHLALALFVLIPIVPQLAAQINYDNLLIPLVALVCLLCFRVTDTLNEKKFPTLDMLILFSICLLTSLVSYIFLPIFFAVIVFLVIVIFKNFRTNLNKLWSIIKKGFLSYKLIYRALIISLFVLSLGLFMQRYGLNALKYHSINPDCAKVLTVKDCSAYSSWYFNYTNHLLILNNHYKPSTSILYYLGQWFYWMWYRLFFAVNGSTSSYTNYPPLPLPAFAAILIGVSGMIAILKFRLRLINKSLYGLFLFLCCAFYIASLILKGYATYHSTAVLENMNGRYLLPVLLLIVALVGRTLSIALRNSDRLKAFLAILVLFLFMQGGGILTFITRSDESWYWPNSKVVNANNTARKLTSPVLFKGQKTYYTTLWMFN